MWLAEMARYESGGGYIPEDVRSQINDCEATRNPRIIIMGVQFDMDLDSFADAIRHIEQAMPWDLESGPEAEAVIEIEPVQACLKFGL